jgi:arabinofuranan 3-O-arabinosyltransferase
LCKGPERSSQRNFGAQSAVGNYLFFVDSDMELTPKVVEDCVKVTNGNHIDAVIIPEISIGDGFWANCKALERSCYVGDDTIEAARFFSKSVFFSIGCFDEQITGQEDWDLQARIGKAGYKTGRVCSFIVHNEEHMSLRKTMIKKRNYGKTLKMYTRKHPKATAAQLTLIRPAFIRNWRKLSKDPLHTSGMLFMKICEITASWIGLW